MPLKPNSAVSPGALGWPVGRYARVKSYRERGLGVIRFGKRWAVSHFGVLLCEFPSRHFARAYRRALYWGDMELVAAMIWFSFIPAVGRAN